MVIIDKIDWPEATVFVDFTYDAANAVPIIRVVFFVEGYAIVPHGNQLSAFGCIEPYALVHDSI